MKLFPLLADHSLIADGTQVAIRTFEEFRTLGKLIKTGLTKAHRSAVAARQANDGNVTSIFLAILKFPNLPHGEEECESDIITLTLPPHCQQALKAPSKKMELQFAWQDDEAALKFYGEAPAEDVQLEVNSKHPAFTL